MNRYFLRDMAERAVSTYLQTLIGLLIASSVIDVAALKAAAVAAIPAALSVLKSILANRYAPGTISPASLVTTPSPFRPSLSAESFHDEA